MTGLDLFAAQTAIEAYVVASLPNIFVGSGSVPDAKSLIYVNGVLEPYVILRFSNLMPVSGGGSFAGAKHGEYYSYVDALCVADTDVSARQVASTVNRIMIGKTFDNVTEIGISYGGGVFAIALDSGHPLAFIAVASFRFETNVSDVGANSLVT